MVRTDYWSWHFAMLEALRLSRSEGVKHRVSSVAYPGDTHHKWRVSRAEAEPCS